MDKIYQSRPGAYPATIYIAPIGQYDDDNITYQQGVTAGNAVLFDGRRLVMPKAEFEANFVIKDGGNDG